MSQTSQTHLFCIPHAGASAAAAYSPWGRRLPSDIKVVPLERAGHGRRTPEPFHASIEESVADMLAIVAPVAERMPYALCGHSMGSTLAYELARALAARGVPAPRAMFLSGRNPPHRSYGQRHLHLLDDATFLAEIRKLGGTPDAFFDMPELIKAFLPGLRNDYRMIELYRPSEHVHVTPADIVFLCGSRDALVTKPDVFEWQRYTSGAFNLREFTGGHFFLNDHAAEVCRMIASQLEDCFV